MLSPRGLSEKLATGTGMAGVKGLVGILVCFGIVLGVWSCVYLFGRGLVEVDKCLDGGAGCGTRKLRNVVLSFQSNLA